MLTDEARFHSVPPIHFTGVEIIPTAIVESYLLSYRQTGKLFDVFLTVHHSIDFFKLPN